MSVIRSIEQFRRKRAINRVRRELAFWGIHTDALTDDQLIEKLDEVQRRFQEVMDSVTLTTLQLAEAFRSFGEALAKAEQEDFFPPIDKDKLVIRVRPLE